MARNRVSAEPKDTVVKSSAVKALQEIKSGKPSRAEAEEAIRTLLRWAGDDPTREGLVDTPARVARGEERNLAVRVVELLHGLDQKDLSLPLAYEAARTLIDEAQIAALAGVMMRPLATTVCTRSPRTASYASIGAPKSQLRAMNIAATAASATMAARLIQR